LEIFEWRVFYTCPYATKCNYPYRDVGGVPEFLRETAGDGDHSDGVASRDGGYA